MGVGRSRITVSRCRVSAMISWCCPAHAQNQIDARSTVLYAAIPNLRGFVWSGCGDRWVVLSSWRG